PCVAPDPKSRPAAPAPRSPCVAGALLAASLDAALSIDGKGRVYVADTHRDVVYRFDPATDAFMTIGGRGGLRFAGDGVDDSLADPAYPAFDTQGNLYVSDTGHKQVKRVPAREL
ncbi:MAG: hypothetical protein ACK46X_22130, partial [Candidatus Sericytochromatia bacterium]